CMRVDVLVARQFQEHHCFYDRSGQGKGLPFVCRLLMGWSFLCIALGRSLRVFRLSFGYGTLQSFCWGHWFSRQKWLDCAIDFVGLLQVEDFRGSNDQNSSGQGAGCLHFAAHSLLYLFGSQTESPLT